MSKLLYGATMSLDGFIAGAGGDMSWLADYLQPNPTMADLPDQIGALLVGARTFYGDDPNRGTDKEGPFGGGWHGPQVVLTHNPPSEPQPGFEFYDELLPAVRAAKAAAGDKYVCILGANVAHQCLDAGVLDEVLVSIAPVFLGDGTRLFERPGGTNVRLERVNLTSTPIVLNTWYRVVRDGTQE
jgi:dihydrofolate reductase